MGKDYYDGFNSSIQSDEFHDDLDANFYSTEDDVPVDYGWDDRF